MPEPDLHLDLNRRLRRLEAAQEILALKAHYCDLCDDGYDPDRLASLFTDDAIWDGGQVGRFEGRDAIRAFFAGMPAAMSMAIHHVTNPVVTVADDATTAEGRWYLLQAATLAATNQAVWLAGRYHDHFTHDGERWRFHRITITSRLFTPYDRGWAEVPFLPTGRSR